MSDLIGFASRVKELMERHEDAAPWVLFDFVKKAERADVELVADIARLMEEAHAPMSFLKEAIWYIESDRL